MSRIKKTSPLLNLTNFQTFILDNNPLSQYFRISELSDLLTSGKNGFLIEGSTFLKPSTEIKIEVLDTEGNPLFVQPGEGIPEYYEGLSKLITVHVYQDTPIGIGKITILGELEKYIDDDGFIQDIPEDWKGIYNIKWERDIKINKNIPNETRVRFVRKPQIIIEELNESFYSRNLVTQTQTSGLVRGVALTPSEGTQFNGYRGGVRYLIQNQSGNFFDEGTFISVTGTNLQNLEVIEYLNQNTIVVQTPFTSSAGVVSNFTDKNYTLTYQYNQNPVASSILGSFGRFEINHLQTFVGDVERIKVFKKSRASNVDYNVIQDTRVEAAELLTTIVSGSNIDTGHFSASYEGGKSWNNFWVTQSSAGASLDSSKIYRAVKLQNNRLSTNLGDDIRLESGSEYRLQFYNYYETSSNDISDTLKVYLTSTERSGSGIANYYVTQSLVTLTGSNEVRNANLRTYNFVPPITDNWTVHFEADNTTANSYWHVGSVSLQASHELGFSPDEFSFIIPIDRDLERETFDFKFEFFDINNNYVPITVVTAQTFQSGNIGLIDKNIIVDVDKQFFNFSSSLEGLPSSQSISITGTKNRILGNLLITSQAFDTGGIELPTSSYIGSEYPGRLDFFEQDLYSLSASLSIGKFTGSLHTSSIVDRITYTLTEIESVQPFIKRFTISRLVAGASGQDGTDSKAIFVSANTNQFIYEPTGPSLKPTGQIILIDVKKQNLVSGSTSPNLIINSSSNYPLTQVGSESGGVISFRLTGSGFPFSAGEVTYAFTGSDEFSNSYSDFVKITPVMNFDGVSVVLSSEATTFPAISTGVVTSSDLDTGDGEVFMRIGSNEIQHSNGLATGNRFDIVEITASGCTANSTSPTTNSYGISAMSDDSASLDMLIRYKAGDNSTTVDFRKIVSYTKAKKAAPVLEFVIGNNNQSTDAKSTGAQITSFATSTLFVKEQYNGSSTILNLASQPTINSSSAFTPITKTTTLLTYPTMATGTDSIELSITGSVTDSENVNRTVFGNVSLTKLKKAAPVLEFVISNNNQSVDAKSTGAQLTSFGVSTLSVREVYNGSSTNLTLSAAPTINSSSAFTTITKSATSLTYPTMASGTNSVELFITGSVTDSEGSDREVYGGVSLTKVKKAAPSILLTATPQTQTVSATSASVQTGTLQTVSLDALEGTASVFNSASILSTNFTGGSISTTTLTLGTIPNANTAGSASIGINYTDSEGTTASKTINVSATKATAGASGSKGDPGTDGTDGTDGRRTATGMVHYQITATSAPATPSATSYNFSTGVFTGLTANWGTGAPTYASGNSNKYWYAIYTVVETTAGGGTGTPTFGSPTQAIGFSGLVSFTSANAIDNGLGDSLSFGVAGATLINGSNISTGKIISTNYSAGTPYTTAGTIIDLDNGRIATKTFYVDSSGNAVFKGTLSAAAGTFAGNLSAVGGTFSGSLQAATGEFSGKITAAEGNIGGWNINSGSLTSSGSIIALDSSGKRISINRDTGVPVVLMNGGLSFASYATGFSNTTTYNNSGLVNGGNFANNYTKTTSNLYTFNSTSGKTYSIKVTDNSPTSDAACRTNSGAISVFRFLNDYDVYLKNTATNAITYLFSNSATGYPGGASGQFTAYFGSPGYFSTTTLSGGATYELYIQSQLQVNGGGYIEDYQFPDITVQIEEVASYSELNGAGFQAGESSTKYIRVRREASNEGATSTTTMLEVGGAISCTGDVVANTSDRRLKTNIKNIESPLEKIKKLNGVTFNWNEIANTYVNKSEEVEEVGLIAQEVQAVLPQLVRPAPFDCNEDGTSKSGENYLTISYDKLVALLIEAVKELQSEVEELKRSNK